jgi:ATP-dependent Lon protease
MELKQKNYSSRLNIPTQFQITNENITERPSVNIQNKKIHTPVFLFVGLQGVGKTSIARSIAQSMNRKFARISLGAIGDVRTLRGTPRYSVDGEPGQIVKSLIRCGTMNPVILLDEIEKSSGNVGLLSDVMATLLEILDPEQNATFVDHYIDHPIDLSNVMFICTANNLGGLSAALLDRVEVIRFTSYSDEEKEVIAKQYILPGVLEEYSLTPDQIQISDDIWISVIRPVGFDAGIRQLERNIATMIRSVARKIVEGESTPIIINKENLSDFLNVDQGPLS